MEEEGFKQQVRLRGHPEDRDVLDCKSKRFDVTFTAKFIVSLDLLELEKEHSGWISPESRDI